MYNKISDYGIIGDMHSAALVSLDGSIDYCSMPHIDSPTVFAAILDDQKGGYFKIQPQEEFTSAQEYLIDTNILKCSFKAKRGSAELIDFMPLGRAELFGKAEHSIHRCLKVISGEINFILECLPRPGYVSESPRIEKDGNIFIIRSKNQEFSLVVKTKSFEVIESQSNIIRITFSLSQGEAAHFDFIYGRAKEPKENLCGFKETEGFWLNWLHGCAAGSCQFLGEHTDMINRSLLALKLLTFNPSGAIAAAATTSLPEEIGGERNWDYRFSWIRDASFTLKALFNLGHIAEADSFIQWLHEVYNKNGSRNLQIMYSLEGETQFSEKTLDHLKGYRGSRPVRVGNAAFGQNQWDIYGEIMDSALRLSDYAGKIDEELWPFFKDVCNLAVGHWQKPDDGIWEVRNGPFHFIYSKVMCWVALDRGIKIAKRYGFSAPLNNWEKEKDLIKSEVLEKGYDARLKSFVQRYGSKDLDSSLLLLPLMGFLPFNDQRIENTIKAVQEQLMKSGYLLRYSGGDGLKGKEGGFILCNFWLIECLANSGRIDQANKVLAKTLEAANHLGLFSEEYDYENREMLGNFPQAFSHIGFINAVSAILNTQIKASQNKNLPNWAERAKKIIPRKVILNQTHAVDKENIGNIAFELKIKLNNLQGAFFDATEGKVDYNRMRQSQSYRDYVILAQKLNFFNPYSLESDAEKKAFWINIYNILIIHGVIELNIKDSVKEVFNFFSRIFYSIGGRQFSPEDVEHGILRRNRPSPGSKIKQFSWRDKRKELCLSEFDPRIHFALVCAASSCPPIEFYDSGSIEQQLDTAARSFMNRSGFELDKASNTLFLSQIFKWYMPDFGKSEQEMLGYILQFVAEEKQSYILDKKRELVIQYLPYDWNLNKTLGE